MKLRHFRKARHRYTSEKGGTVVEFGMSLVFLLALLGFILDTGVKISHMTWMGQVAYQVAWRASTVVTSERQRAVDDFSQSLFTFQSDKSSIPIPTDLIVETNLQSDRNALRASVRGTLRSLWTPKSNSMASAVVESPLLVLSEGFTSSYDASAGVTGTIKYDCLGNPCSGSSCPNTLSRCFSCPDASSTSCTASTSGEGD